MAFSGEKIRNIALLGHNGVGKTQLNEAILYIAGAIPSAGRTDDGKTVSDYTEEEIQRKMSIHASLSSFEYNAHRINILDAPGTADFVGECVLVMRASETAVMVVDAVNGPEIETFKLWRRLNERNKPRLVFINKMDKDRADFDKVYDELTEEFDKHFLPVVIPMGQGADYKGVIDIIEQKAYFIQSSGAPQSKEIPDEYKEKVASYREKLIEVAAEGADDLMEKYFAENTLSYEEIIRGVKGGLDKATFVPVFCGSAEKLSGVFPLLDFVINFCPSPENRRDYILNSNGEREDIHISDNGAFSGYIIKTVIDQFSGRMNFIKVVTGVLKSDTEVKNPETGKKARIGKLYRALGKKLIETNELKAGDIGIITKCEIAPTNSTITSDPESTTLFAPLRFPSPIYSLSIKADDKKNEVKINELLHRITEEDITFKTSYNEETQETTISGMGLIHTDFVLSLIKDKLKVNINTALPKVAYRETITKKSPLTEFTHKKQSGGHGQYARVVIEAEPLARGEYYQFQNIIKGMAVSKGYVPGIEKGLKDAMKEGVLAGYPVVDIGITLSDGKEHPVDSSEMAFRMASSGALKEAMSKAGPVLLEPFGKLKVYAEAKYIGDILSDLSSRRARVTGQEDFGNLSAINAEIPISSTLDYAIVLKSLTSGTGSFELEEDHYEPLVGKGADEVIRAKKEESK